MLRLSLAWNPQAEQHMFSVGSLEPRALGMGATLPLGQLQPQPWGPGSPWTVSLSWTVSLALSSLPFAPGEHFGYWQCNSTC